MQGIILVEEGEQPCKEEELTSSGRGTNLVGDRKDDIDSRYASIAHAWNKWQPLYRVLYWVVETHEDTHCELADCE